MKPNKQYIDLIGDIHGHADELKALLKKLGYRQHGGSYKHDDGRTVLFLGDHIDRGPKIKEALAIVCGMVEAGVWACYRLAGPNRSMTYEHCIQGS
jgi:hypothetical protein